MMWDKKVPPPTDAVLVAYLDGELSPAESVSIGQRIAGDPRLAARVEHLTKGVRPFRDAFEPLLAAAPADRLDSMLDAMLARDGALNAGLSHRRRWPVAMTAALGLLLLGAGLDRLTAPSGGEPSLGEADGAEDWHDAVAHYLTLYTRETLSAVPNLADAGPAALAKLGESLGLGLTSDRMSLPGLTLKRADLYEYDGKPLAFLGYLDLEDGPVALCIVRQNGPETSSKTEQRLGMNVVSWARGHHGFMVIGRAPPERLKALAAMISTRFEHDAADRG